MATPKNLIHEVSATTGTGNFTLTAVNGRVRFSDATYGFGTGASPNVFDYFIQNRDAAEWEIGTGHMSATSTLVRDTVVFSSNSNALVNFSAGVKDVTNAVIASKIARTGDSHNVSFGTLTAGNTTVTGTATVTTSSASGFTVGANGATNPVLKIDASTASVATGVSIKGAAAAARVALSVISSGTNEGLSIDAKGSGTIRLGATSTGDIEFSRNAVPTASDGAAIGTTSLMWSDIFLASGGLLDFNNGNMRIAHSAGSLTISGVANASTLTLSLTAPASSHAFFLMSAPTNGYVTVNRNQTFSRTWDFGAASAGHPYGDTFYISDLTTFGRALTVTGSTGEVKIWSSTAATSTTTGSLVVTGGGGFAKPIYVGTNSGIFNGVLGDMTAPTADNLAIALYKVSSTNFGGFGAYSADGSVYVVTSSAGVAGTRAVWAADGSSYYPYVNATTSSGTASKRWSTVYTGALAATGSIASSSASAGIGYATGAGGTVTQSPSKSSGVTLNTVTGQITTSGSGLAGGTVVSFTLTNSAISANDLLVLNHLSGGTAGAYTLTSQPASGSTVISIRNNTAGNLSETLVIGFAVIKSVTS